MGQNICGVLVKEVAVTEKVVESDEPKAARVVGVVKVWMAEEAAMEEVVGVVKVWMVEEAAMEEVVMALKVWMVEEVAMEVVVGVVKVWVVEAPVGIEVEVKLCQEVIQNKSGLFILGSMWMFT